MLTQARLAELLTYNPETGVFTWAVNRGRLRVGDIAGTLSQGYISIVLDYKPYRAHRLAWLYVHGCWPSEFLDHINGKRDDNRIVNLREASSAENSQNAALRSDNKTGTPGVHLFKATGKFASSIWVDRKKHHLGYFDSSEDAAIAYAAAKEVFHTFAPTLRSIGVVQ